MAATGIPLQVIAAHVGKRPQTVAAWLSEEAGDERILNERAKYEAYLLELKSRHHFNMAERYNLAMRAIDDGLGPNSDIRVRLETARYVIDEIRPPKERDLLKDAVGGDTAENVTEVGKFLGTMIGLVQDIRDNFNPKSFERSVAHGIAALPAPAAAPPPDPEETQVDNA